MKKQNRVDFNVTIEIEKHMTDLSEQQKTTTSYIYSFSGNSNGSRGIREIREIRRTLKDT